MSKSHAKLAAALRAMGHRIGKSSIPKLLSVLNDRRQANRRTLDAAVMSAQATGQSVISVGTKKEELVGPYKDVGSDYRPQGCPEQVRGHYFIDAYRPTML